MLNWRKFAGILLIFWVAGCSSELGNVSAPSCDLECRDEVAVRALREGMKLIYNIKLSDRMMLRTLAERQKAGVEIRVIGKIEKEMPGIEARKLASMRLHVRAIVRDGATAFVGSQNLRKLELDGRREVGMIVTDTRIAKKIQSVFEADWDESGGKAEPEAASPPAEEAIPASAAR